MQYLRFVPNETTPQRVHHLGMAVYNQTGVELSEKEWAEKFRVIEEAYKILITCIPVEDSRQERELRRRGVVILPQERIIIGGQHVYGFASFRIYLGSFRMALYPYIFVRRNDFIARNLRHEWIHEYLRISGKWPDGDVEHQDELFQRCEYTPGLS